VRLLIATASLIAISSCEARRMGTVVGRHAIIHWNPEERTLCGGTLEYVDSLLEITADTYEVNLPAQPAIEIYWDFEGLLASGLCGSPAGGCTAPFPNGTALLVSPDVTHTHELVHAVRLTGAHHGMPAFFGEGVAVRWERDPATPLWWRASVFPDQEPPREVRALLDQRRLDGFAYSYAGFFWTWLESEYGGRTMAGFASTLQRFSPAADIEREFRLNFGMSFEDAVKAFEGQPPLIFDLHACAMDHLPQLAWNDQPLQLAEGSSSCDSAEVINVMSSLLDDYHGVARLSHLQLPDAAQLYDITIAGPAEGYLLLEPCVGQARPYQPSIIISPADGQVSVPLSGKYLVTTVAPFVRGDAIEFVEARLEAR
jgi:hypothetical protein